MTYTQECDLGRFNAAHAIEDYRATGNAPRLVRAIREAAADESGLGAGFVFALAEEVRK